MNISAAILADGQNSRIKMEKSLIKFGDIHLIEKQVNLLNRIFSRIIIVTSKSVIKEKLTDLTYVQDQFPQCGPLGGIHSALLNCTDQAVFVFACDMPNLRLDIIQKQIEFYKSKPCDALVPRHCEGIEPLHAIYARTCLFAIENNLRNRIFSVRSFYDQINMQYIPVDPENIRYYHNINTHNDLQKAENYLNCKVSNPL
jgi:molybdopterin-guanine dinucleotide biosynthesis protein A